MPASTSPSFDFLPPAEGEMTGRIRAFDWTPTPAGPPDQWPTELKTALHIMLSARFPMFLAWGEELTYFYNDDFIPILGARHPCALGNELRKIAPEAWEQVSVLVGQVMAGQSVYHKDLPFRLLRNGYEEVAWFTVSYSPVCGPQHAIRGVLAICVETTQRIQADKARMAEISWLREMFEQAPVPMAVFVGPDHRYEISNAANQECLGHRPVIGLPVREALPEAVEQGFVELLDRVYRTGEPFSGRGVPIRFRRVDGTPAQVFMDVIYQPLRDRSGEVIGIFAVANDTTQVVSATQALRASEARLRTIIDAVPQMVWSASPDGTNNYFNRQWYEFTGMPEGSLAGWDAVHPEDRAGNTVNWSRCIAEGTPYEAKNRLRHRSGEYRWTLVRAQPVKDERGNITEWIGTNTDIHDQEMATEALQNANKLKDDFLAMLAHELRNPLAPISAAAELLALKAGDDPLLSQSGTIIGRQVRHIVRLVDDLLDVSRVTRGLIHLDKSVLDIKQVIADAIEQVRPLIEQRRHRFTLELTPDSVHILGDHNRLVQILVNLLNNAAKYTDDGGHVSLSLEAEPRWVTLSVRDNGQGMSPEQARLAFDLFYQGERTIDRTQGGLGIGLALVKSLTEQHGGNVVARSEGAGQGSQFILKLPRQAPEAAQQAAHDTAARAKASGLDILVVDDNADAALSIAALLETMGNRVAIANSAEDALARDGGGSFDLYLLDIGLPGMDGHALMRTLRRRGTGRDSMFVALSGYGTDQAGYTPDTDESFDHHVVKPISVRQLQELLDSYDGGKQALPE